MRNIILIMFVFVTTSLFAQKFEIGVNGGIGYNTTPAISETYTSVNSSAQAPPASVAGMLKLAYNYKKWQFGIEAGYINLTYKFWGKQYYIINSQIVELYNQPEKGTLGNPAIPVKLFTDRKIVFKHSEIYGGISAGYVLLTNGFIPPAEFNQVVPSKHGNGFTAGIQAGATYFVTKHIGINAEFQGNYMALSLDGTKYNLFEFPETLGIRYGF